ncbi:MAG: ribonuclease R [Bacteroidota bacterium]|nr:ribonuclease R [Bacteroidota bacterium]MDP4232930.1 ribonuclease R [Bacteroidota bacterium]MDP4241974.1 ribonuclease R [Bacteroidota bacterium]MDP4286877.1 ribonuclease R [Bacteroidota bacterium]
MKKNQNSVSLRDDLLNLLRDSPGEYFKTNEISKMLAIKSDSEQYQDLRRMLDALEGEGRIVRGSRRRYGLARPIFSEIEGELRMQATGNAVVTPTAEFDVGDTILVRSRNLATALDGDYVRVRLLAPKEGERPQGEILEIIRKAAHQVTGTIEHTRQGFLLRPEGAKIKRDVFISRKDLHGAREGDRVRVELYEWTDEYLQPEGFVLEVLAKPARPGAFDNESIVTELNLPRQFPSSVEKEVARFPATIPESEIQKRLDLRRETIFTIDPEDAKDFDDAVSLTHNDDGLVTLGVHIADVSHYVTENSQLDKEALERGTSVYLVGGVIPMLPERLSNELCSLRPDEDKLTYSVFMRMDPKTGIVISSELKKTVIRSVMRFSYDEAEQRTKTGRGKYAKLLKEMRALSLKMYERRREAGSIDFESEEFRFNFNEAGEPIESIRKERLGSMRMIEDFMLAANRAVAEFIARKAKQGSERPFIYRIHAEPDPAKVREVAQLAKTLGYKLNAEKPTPKVVQKFLETLKGKPEEHLLNQLMLRAMAKAVYAEHNVGHFGLAFLHYTHFTSPIRRYPDLIVHRLLAEYQRPGGMNREREHHYFELLPDIADQTSALERRATEAERESVKLAQIHILKSQIGDEFDGIISGVTHFGIFVAISSGAEGLVHIRELPGYFEFDEAHYSLVQKRGMHGAEGKRYRIGDPVRVQLVRVLEEKRKIDFRLADVSDGETIKPLAGEKARRPKLRQERVAGRPRKEPRPKRRSR